MDVHGLLVVISYRMSVDFVEESYIPKFSYFWR